MDINEAVDFISDVHGFDDESSGVGEAWEVVCKRIRELETERDELRGLLAKAVPYVSHTTKPDDPQYTMDLLCKMSAAIGGE